MVLKIAIDGPAASGKSSAAERVAERLGFDRIDSGLLYRSITYILISFQKDISLHSQETKNLISGIELIFSEGKIYYKKKDITPYLRTTEIDRNVGIVAKELYVRNKVHDIQHYIINSCRNGVVVDGRDIGTVVMPDAFLKIFITAKDTTRAERRCKQTGLDYEEVLCDIRKRDESDIKRKHGPLKIADDAIVIENDNITLNETVDKIVSIFFEKKNK